MLSITLRSTIQNVIVYFLQNLVSIVNDVFRNPLFSIIPIPISVIINMLNGVKAVKLDTVDVKIYFIPLKFSSDTTLSDVAIYSPVVVSILL